MASKPKRGRPTKNGKSRAAEVAAEEEAPLQPQQLDVANGRSLEPEQPGGKGGRRKRPRAAESDEGAFQHI